MAIKNNIPVIERSELLYLVSKQYKNVIAISGTHGKTTTTAMIAYIFMLCGFICRGRIDCVNAVLRPVADI